MISSTKQQAIVGGPFHFRFTVAVAMEDLLRTPLYHTLRTNHMGYIKVKAQLPGIYGNVNRPCPRAAPSDSGQFTAINPWRLGINYYILGDLTKLFLIRGISLLSYSGIAH